MAKTAKKKKAAAAKKASRPAARAKSRKSSASMAASRRPVAKAKKAKAKPVKAKPAKAKPVKATRASKAKKSAVRIDPLNRKNYTAVTVMLVAQDMNRAADFCVNGLGFKLRGSMKGPDGSLVHAELRNRDTTIMLSPENPQMRSYSAHTIGDTPATLYLLVEDVDEVFASAVAAGGRVRMQVGDMFWGDRCGEIADTEGNKWMIATHKSEPTVAQMQEAMRQMMSQGQSGAPEEAAAAASASGADLFGSEY